MIILLQLLWPTITPEGYTSCNTAMISSSKVDGFLLKGKKTRSCIVIYWFVVLSHASLAVNHYRITNIHRSPNTELKITSSAPSVYNCINQNLVAVNKSFCLFNHCLMINHGTSWADYGRPADLWSYLKSQPPRRLFLHEWGHKKKPRIVFRCSSAKTVMPNQSALISEGCKTF